MARLGAWTDRVRTAACIHPAEVLRVATTERCGMPLPRWLLMRTARTLDDLASELSAVGVSPAERWPASPDSTGSGCNSSAWG